MVQTQQYRREAASFRDPAGQIVIRDGAIIREVNPSGRADYKLFMESGLYEALRAEWLIISHTESEDKNGLCLKPRQLDFISYPYEWSFSYYKQAALNTLRIAEEAVKHGMMLKDASAFNMQWVDGRMQLIDTLSFIKYEPGMPWFAFPQFLQHFINPMLLMMNRNADLSALSMEFIDGIPSKLTAQLLPWSLHFSFNALAYVYGPAWAKESPNKAMPKISQRQLLIFLASLKSYVLSMRYDLKSAWSNYDDCSYSVAARADKRLVVAQILQHLPFGKVLDLGANTGHYSFAAAIIGHDVTAVDSDHDCIQYITTHKPLIQALKVNICNPTPAIGWNNTERKSFWDRCNPDTIMCLALLHHLCISNNTPLDYVARLFSEHCEHLIIEWVPLEDPKAATIAFNRIFPRYNLDVFKSAFSDYFTIEKERPLVDSKRTIYLMEKR